MRVRTLAEVDAAGHRPWFGPALERLAGIRAHPDPRVAGLLDPAGAVLVARAPGRLDVMGGIADYSGSTVLQLPLANSTFAVLQAAAEPVCEVVSLRAGGVSRLVLEMDDLTTGALRTPGELAAWFRGHPEHAWAAYVAGLAQHYAGTPGRPASPGVRLLIGSQVPEGKGISSSAAVAVAAQAVLAAWSGAAPDDGEAAALCQRLENEVAGAPCGIMDPMTSRGGRRDRLLRLLCQPARVEGHLPVPAGYRFFGIDSGVRHAVTGADYGTVRTAAFMGYRMIAERAGLPVERDGERVRVDDGRWDGYLANVTARELEEADLPAWIGGAEFIARYHGTTDAATRVDPARAYPVRQAAAHPVHEHPRVRRFAERMGEGMDDTAAEEMGGLMYESHESYSACGLGSEGTDLLVRRVREAGPAAGLFGARITGGGSGGTVGVLGRADAGEAVRGIARRYAEETGREALVFDTSGPGAAETGVLRLDRADDAGAP